MKADKIQVIYIKGLGLGAWVENHLRVSPSEIHTMPQWVSRRPKSKFAIGFALQQIKVNRLQ